MSTASKNAGLSESTGRLESGDHVGTLNGVDLHYRVSGKGPLLFLIPAGWGVGSSYLQRGFTFLQDRLRYSAKIRAKTDIGTVGPLLFFTDRLNGLL